MDAKNIEKLVEKAKETVVSYYFSQKGEDGVWRKIEPSFCRL